MGTILIDIIKIQHIASNKIYVWKIYHKCKEKLKKIKLQYKSNAIIWGLKIKIEERK